MIAYGIKASQLIAELTKLIAEHGDQPVFTGGGDYPSGVGGVALQDKHDPYVPQGVFYVWSKG